jgi:hypothetical protein
MCWSQQVSWGFAVAEALSLLLLCRLAGGFAGPVKHMRPLLASICLIEVLEAFFWPTVSVSSAGNRCGISCGSGNRFITLAIFANLSVQPLLVNLAALALAKLAKAQPQREAFEITSRMAAALAVCFLGALALGEIGEVDIVPFEATGKLGMHATETCSLLGAHGHLHWVFKMSANFMLPNGFAYVLMMLPPLFARPWHLLAAPLGAYLAIFAGLFFSMGYSFEAGSVWCWSAIGLHCYAYIMCLFARQRRKTAEVSHRRTQRRNKLRRRS